MNDATTVFVRGGTAMNTNDTRIEIGTAMIVAAPTVRAPALDPTDERRVETEHGDAIEAPADETAGNG